MSVTLRQKVVKNLTITGLMFAASVLESLAFAAGNSILMPPRDSYVGARAQGMGNAFVAVADDEGAIFSNPAGIGREDGKNSKSLLRGASFPNATIGFNRTPRDLQLALVRMDEGSTALQRILKELDEHESNFLRMGLFPYFTLGRFQMGLLVDQELNTNRVRYDTPQESEFDGLTYNSKLKFLSRSQMGGVLGFSAPYHQFGLSFGLSARATTRTTVMTELETSEDVVLLSSQKLGKEANKTSGIAGDAGILYEISPKGFVPTLGVAVRDIGNTTYRAASATEDAEIEKMNVVAGMSIRPPLGKNFGSVVSFEAHRINDSRVIVKDKLRFGMELGMFGNDSSAPLLFRVGHNTRTLSYGVSADLVLLKLDLGKYDELVDTVDGRTVAEARYVARLSIDLR